MVLTTTSLNWTKVSTSCWSKVKKKNLLSAMRLLLKARLCLRAQTHLRTTMLMWVIIMKKKHELKTPSSTTNFPSSRNMVPMWMSKTVRHHRLLLPLPEWPVAGLHGGGNEQILTSEDDEEEQKLDRDYRRWTQTPYKCLFGYGNCSVANASRLLG